jgi:hypothetical protein
MMMPATTQTSAPSKTRWSGRTGPKNRNRNKKRAVLYWTKTKEWSLRSAGRRDFLEMRRKRREKR